VYMHPCRLACLLLVLSLLGGARGARADGVPPPVRARCVYWSEGNAAWQGRGGAGVALTNESATGLVNPAGLPRLAPDAQGTAWAGELGYSSDTIDRMSLTVYDVAARRAGQDWGIALGFGDFGKSEAWYAAYGARCRRDPHWTWGTLAYWPDLNQVRQDLTWTLGVQYAAPLPTGRSLITWSAGAVLGDVTDEYGNLPGSGRHVNLGAGLTGERWRLGVDITDAFGATGVPGAANVGPKWQLGGEYSVTPYLVARLGRSDGLPTGGVSLVHEHLALDYGYWKMAPPADYLGLMSIRYRFDW